MRVCVEKRSKECCAVSICSIRMHNILASNGKLLVVDRGNVICGVHSIFPSMAIVSHVKTVRVFVESMPVEVDPINDGKLSACGGMLTSSRE